MVRELPRPPTLVERLVDRLRYLILLRLRFLHDRRVQLEVFVTVAKDIVVNLQNPAVVDVESAVLYPSDNLVVEVGALVLERWTVDLRRNLESPAFERVHRGILWAHHVEIT